MTHDYDHGYTRGPFTTLVSDFPGTDVYPPQDFRVEWGPIFHRGRLDGTARVLVLGQDPGAHESIARRILVGEAGQRIQGFLARLGVTKSYVMINTFVYSVFGQAGGSRHHKDPLIAGYRHRWLDALLVGTQVEAVVALGTLADEAFQTWQETPSGQGVQVAYRHVLHPTYPESASASGQTTMADAMKRLLDDWNLALQELKPAISHPDVQVDLLPYGEVLVDADLAAIPEADLPAGVPPWMRSLAAWAARVGATTEDKRATVVVTVPTAERPWQPLA